MTKSPVSSCGVYFGLCLPRRTLAISLARRPRGLPVASTTHQARDAWACALVITKRLAGERAGGGLGLRGRQIEPFERGRQQAREPRGARETTRRASPCQGEAGELDASHRAPSAASGAREMTLRQPIHAELPGHCERSTRSAPYAAAGPRRGRCLSATSRGTATRFRRLAERRRRRRLCVISSKSSCLQGVPASARRPSGRHAVVRCHVQSNLRLDAATSSQPPRSPALERREYGLERLPLERRAPPSVPRSRRASPRTARTRASGRCSSISPELVLVHRDGRVVYVNPAVGAGARLASARGPGRGALARDVFHPDDRGDRPSAGPRRRAANATARDLRLALALRRTGRIGRPRRSRRRVDFDGDAGRRRRRARRDRAGRVPAPAPPARSHGGARARSPPGVAHEINNPLTYLLVNLEHVLRRLRARERQRRSDRRARAAEATTASGLAASRSRSSTRSRAPTACARSCATS